jgi:hypothetical protein
MLAEFEQRDVPWLRALAHCRISELCLQVEEGEQARRHVMIALPMLERVGPGPRDPVVVGAGQPAGRSL